VTRRRRATPWRTSAPRPIGRFAGSDAVQGEPRRASIARPVYLTPNEEDRVRVFSVAQLARATTARGLKLNAPEATALICDEMHLAARAGASFDDVLEAGRGAVAVEDLMDGVKELLDEIRVEVLLDDGTRLMVLRSPWG
jgi:urease subunit gamma/beta